MFSKRTIHQIKRHAIREYPLESCGFVVKRKYVPAKNMAENPERDFLISTEDFLAAQKMGKIECIVHSHPNGPDHPTKQDMVGQMSSGCPWGIVVTDGAAAKEPFFWGGGVPIPDLIGRPFRHGVTDCYALLRDWFKLERGINLPNFAREDEWWAQSEDMFTAFFESAGFVEIEHVEEPGDCVIGRVLGPVDNHCAVYIGDGLILHHLSRRLSRREPLHRWRKFISRHVRYVGRKDG